MRLVKLIIVLLCLLDDFHKFWSIASKLVPSPSPTSIPGVPSSPALSNAVTFETGHKLPVADAMRSIPMRIYLPHGGPVVQDIVPALIQSSDGRSAPQTLQSALSSLLPALFPPSQRAGESATSASVTHMGKQIVMRIIVQGIQMPLEAELGWCAACLSYPDGWLGVVLGF